MFELVEKALDEMTFFVKLSVILALLGAVFLRRNDRFSTHLGDGEKHMLGVIGFIAHHKFRFIIFK